MQLWLEVGGLRVVPNQCGAQGRHVTRWEGRSEGDRRVISYVPLSLPVRLGGWRLIVHMMTDLLLLY